MNRSLAVVKGCHRSARFSAMGDLVSAEGSDVGAKTFWTRRSHARSLGPFSQDMKRSRYRGHPYVFFGRWDLGGIVG